MKTDTSDTNPEIERVQYEILRKLGPAQRVRLMRSLSQEVMQMSWRAIQRASPDASDEEIDLLFVAMAYGDELAGKLRANLAERKTQEL